MKIGPIEIKLANQPITKKATLPIETGKTGTTIYSGILYDEYNTDLQHTKKYEIYDTMRKSDGMIAATLMGCELPLRTAVWSIESASEDNQDKEIANFVKEDLFENMSIVFDDFLRHILLMNAFGFSLFEKIYELKEDQRYHWRKFAPRLPKTSWSWEFDDRNGELKSWTQKVMKGEQSGTYTIPAKDLLIFTIGKEGSNYEGTSLLRSCYKHWYYKDQLYRIAAMAFERHGMGIPVIGLPIGYTDPDVTRAKNIGESVRAHERAYVVLPPNWEFKIEGVTGQLADPFRLIKHHNELIALNVLEQFLLLGMTETGARSLGETMTDFFLMALQASTKTIEDTFNYHAIKPIVDYNWNGVKKYPKLRCSRLQATDFERLSKTLLSFGQAGFIQPDSGIEDALRTQLDLPQKVDLETNPNYQNTKKRINDQFDIKQKTQVGGYNGEKEKEEKQKRQEQGLREPTELENNILALKEMEGGLDNAADIFVKKVKGIQKEQIENIAYEVSKRTVEDMINVKARYISQMADNIKDVLYDVYRFGREQVKGEIVRQNKPQRLLKEKEEPITAEEAIIAYLAAKSVLVSRRLAQKYLDTATLSAMNYKRTGLDNNIIKEQILSSLEDLSDRELETTANMAVMEAFGMGRNAEADKYSEEITTAVYSAVMDAKSCIPCRSLDGVRHRLNDPQYATPNPRCSGGLRCRCITVYLMKEII